MPLDICGADSQGGIGYMIERMLRNVLKKHGINKEVCCLVTPIIVDNKNKRVESVKRYETDKEIKENIHIKISNFVKLKLSILLIIDLF